MTFGTTFYAILAAGATLGTLSAQVIPTHMTFRADRPWKAAEPEDYPEIVAVTYDAMSGPYFAPRAYSAVAPVIRHASLSAIDDLPRFDDYAEPEPVEQTLEPAMDISAQAVIEPMDEAGYAPVVEDY